MRSAHILLLGLLALAMACSDDAPIDIRFITPIATVQTLLEVYGVADLPQEEIDRRLELRRQFHLNDPAALRECFADWDEPSDEGLAGYVFGSVILAKDDLVATIRDDEASVSIRDPERRSRPIELRREDGSWRIVLDQSVPRNIQAQLRSKWEESSPRASPLP